VDWKYHAKSLMEYLIFIGFTLLFLLGIFRYKSFDINGLSRKMIALAFGAKMAAGLVYMLVQAQFYKGGDAYKYFKGGRVIYESLWENPMYFLRLVFGKNGGFVDTPIYKYAYHTECWDHLGSYAFCRFNALLHLISGGYYSVHVLVMSILMLVAGLNFYRLLQPLKLMSDIWLYVLIFFTPPLLFWTGGIYKEGMVYLGLSCCLLGTYRIAKNNFSLKYFLLIITGLSLILLFRNYLIILLLPALCLLFYTLKFPKKALLKYTLAYAFGLILLITLAPFLPVNFYEILAHKQWAFLAENGGSDFGATQLEPTFGSIAGAVPQGLVNTLFRPFLWDASGVLQVISAVGISLVWVFVLTAFFYRKKQYTWHPVMLFLLFYALSNLMLIGILVSNSGTMMRYRVIAIHFLILVVAQASRLLARRSEARSH